MSRESRILTVAVVCAVLLAALLFYVVTFGAQVQLEWTRRSLLSGIHIGMTRAQLIAAKGQPDHIAYSARDLDTQNYFPVPSRPIEKEVLEYHEFVWRVFVYIDKHDKVSGYCLAST